LSTRFHSRFLKYSARFAKKTFVENVSSPDCFAPLPNWFAIFRALFSSLNLSIETKTSLVNAAAELTSIHSRRSFIFFASISIQIFCVVLFFYIQFFFVFSVWLCRLYINCADIWRHSTAWFFAFLDVKLIGTGFFSSISSYSLYSNWHDAILISNNVER